VPRSPRLDAPGLVHHVVTRGIERRRIFIDDDDRLDLLERLSAVLPQAAIECLTWALMDNHFHLVLRTRAAPLARAMARVLTGYALHFNRRHARVGHLFQNRYYSRPVRTDPELIAVIAYVHRNPLAAGIVDSPRALAAHPWTGHAALMGAVEPWPFHTVGRALRVFGASAPEARRELAHWLTRAEPGLIEDGAAPREDEAVADPAPHDDAPADVAGLIEAVCLRLAIEPQALALGRRTAPVATGRAVIAYLAARRGWSLVRLGPQLGVRPDGLYRTLERGRKAVLDRSELAGLA
jgi:REP element-mobilizing transposase RayT